MEVSHRVVILRQKRVKNQEEKLAKVSYLLEGNPFENMGRWNEAFSNRNDIYLEIGCGQGKFIISHAKEEQDKNFIAIEKPDFHRQIYRGHTGYVQGKRNCRDILKLQRSVAEEQTCEKETHTQQVFGRI